MTQEPRGAAEESVTSSEDMGGPTRIERATDVAPEPTTDAGQGDEAAAASIAGSLVSLGFVGFDHGSTANDTSGVMVSPDRRRAFRRDVYVGINDEEQQSEFLGRVVEGPFHAPHEISAESAISRTTLLYPERTQFRPTYYVYGSIEVLGEIRDGERLVATPTRPRPYAEVSIFPADRLRSMLGLDGEFYLGHLMGYDAVDVSADVSNKNFLPRNVGVFGTVGSGKSNTTQVIMEEALSAGWAVVVVDVEGEYVRMNEPTADGRMTALLRDSYGLDPVGVDDLRVYVPSSGASDAAAPIRFKVPIAGVGAEIVSDILEMSEPQVRMFTQVTANARRTTGASAATTAARTGPLAGPGAVPPTPAARPYTLQSLIDGLVDPNVPLLGRPPQQTELPTAATLRSKLISLGMSGVLDWNATRATPELPIDDLLVGGRLSVLDVSETDDRSRSIAISYVLQALFDAVIATDEGTSMANGVPRPRVLLVIEEVHTFVSRATAQRMRAVIDQLQIISRRGRKRWMGLALVSQQPGHVPDELFELANTRFIHQLKSTANLAPVRQTTGGVHEALWTSVPSLGPGQCLLTGATFLNPVFVNIRPARSLRMLTN
jgi:uncharacterized protein